MGRRSRVIWQLLVALALCSHLLPQVQFSVVNRQTVEERLKSYKGDDTVREETLKTLLQKAGCANENLREQPVNGSRQPNLMCTLPGTTDSVIVVSGHFDHVSKGDGVVDNWSGASMLPSLYQAVQTSRRKHTFLFIGFSAEEVGLVGSKFYVKNLSPEEIDKISAVVNLDTLGLGPTEVWTSRSNKRLVSALNGMAQALRLPLTGVNVDKVGSSDEEPFIARNVPTVTIHSLTQQTFPILHSSKDVYSAIHFDDYYDSYRLISGYLVFLDQALPVQ